MQYAPHYEKGFALGFVGVKEDPRSVPGVKYINNHLRFIVQYHKPVRRDTTGKLGYRVVGFEVEPFRCASVRAGSA